jgi:hypothetical protein
MKRGSKRKGLERAHAALALEVKYIEMVLVHCVRSRVLALTE